MDSINARQKGFCSSHHIPVEIVNYTRGFVDKSEFDMALSYLQRTGADLKWGDIIIFDTCAGYRNEGVAIFDGAQIIDLYYELRDYGALPPCFHVIENRVPLNYWKDAIYQTAIVWFNHSLVRDECIANIQCDIINDDRYGGSTRVIYTTFTFDDIIYEPEYTSQSTSIAEKIANFIEKLKSNDLFQFETNSMFEEDECNTLFM